MKVQLDTTEFAEHVGWLNSVASAPTSSPWTSAIRLQYADGVLRMGSRTYEAAASSSMEATARDGEGLDVALFGPRLAAVARALPGPLTTLDAKPDRVRVLCEGASFTLCPLICDGPEEVVAAPEGGAAVEAAWLHGALRLAAGSAAKEPGSPPLAGVHLAAHDGRLRVEGASRATMARAVGEWGGADFDVTAAPALTAAVSAKAGTVHLAADSRSIAILSGPRLLVARTIKCRYPDTDSLVPQVQEFAFELSMNAGSLRDAIAAAMLVAERAFQAKMALIRLQVEGDRLLVGGQDGDEEAQVSIPCRVDGEPEGVWYNGLLLGPLVSAIAGNGPLTLKVRSPLAQTLVVGEAQEDRFGLIMAVRR